LHSLGDLGYFLIRGRSTLTLGWRLPRIEGDCQVPEIASFSRADVHHCRQF
jgi:hypothetical protein